MDDVAPSGWRDRQEQPEGEETPPLIAYRELAYGHAQQLHELAVLMIEEAAVAADMERNAWSRTWDALRRGHLYMDPDEMLYRFVVRDAVQRLSKARGLRGYQPPTTADGRHITAVGVVSGFAPEQRAAIFLAARGGLGYQVAGAASGLGEGRARDVCLAARQEYASARGLGERATATCSQRLPLLSDRADGQLRERDRPELEEHLSSCVACAEVLTVYQDFSSALKELALPPAAADPLGEALGAPTARPDRRPTGARRFLGVINSTAALFLLLLGGFIVFRFCGSPPPIETGVGRTSDVVYARASDGGGIVALESGSGRKLAQLPSGMLAGNGWLVVGSSHDCRLEGCRTVVVRTDTATGGEAGIGALEGKLELVGVDARGRTAFFADEGSAWSRIVIFDLEQGRAKGEVDAPPEVREAFNPEGRALAAASTILFTLGRSAVDGSLVVVETDLERMGVIGRLPIEGPRELRVGLFPSPRVGRVFVYFPSGPVLQEIEPAAGRVVQTLDLGQGAGASDPFFVPTRGSLVAADPQGQLYVVLPTGGIAVVSPEPLEVLRQLATDRRYRSVGASTDGRVVYAVGFDGSYGVLDANDGRQLVSRPTAEVDDILQVNAGE